MTTASASAPANELAPAAPAWHTVGVLVLLSGLAAAALLGGHSMPAHRLIGYLETIVAEWLIVGFIALAPRWGGASLRTLAGRLSLSFRSIALDTGIAVAYLVVANLVLALLTRLLAHILPAGSPERLRAMLPHTLPEDIIFIAVGLTAGICEEMIFRGYLRHQFARWTGSAAVGIVLQGIVFGAAHAYQGMAMVVVIVVYGCLFGCLAQWRGSLRPGMIAHFLQDGIGGLILAHFMAK